MDYMISDSAFKRLYNYLRHERCIYCGDESGTRRFLEAVFWMARSGAQWRLLPKEYGYWNSVYRRFERWSEQGVWKRMFHYFSKDSDLEWLMIDSTIVRAHSAANGAKGGSKIRHSGAAKVAIAAKSMSASMR